MNKNVDNTVNSAYDYLYNLDSKTLKHYYNKKGKKEDLSIIFNSLYDSTKLGIGSVCGTLTGLTVYDLMDS